MLHDQKQLHPHIRNNKVQPNTSQNFCFNLTYAIVNILYIDEFKL